MPNFWIVDQIYFFGFGGYGDLTIGIGDGECGGGLLPITIPCTWLGKTVWTPNSTNGKCFGISCQHELAI